MHDPRQFLPGGKARHVVDVPLKDATAQLKTVPPEWYQVARAFFG